MPSLRMRTPCHTPYTDRSVPVHSILQALGYKMPFFIKSIRRLHYKPWNMRISSCHHVWWCITSLQITGTRYNDHITSLPLNIELVPLKHSLHQNTNKTHFISTKKEKKKDTLSYLSIYFLTKWVCILSWQAKSLSLRVTKMLHSSEILKAVFKAKNQEILKEEEKSTQKKIQTSGFWCSSKSVTTAMKIQAMLSLYFPSINPSST